MKQRTLRGILTTGLAIVAVLTMGGAALAFSSGPPPAEQPNIPSPDNGAKLAAASATGCRTSYTNGAGASLLEWCYSDDGNITSMVHGQGLQHSTGLEGWCVSGNGTKLGETTGPFANFNLDAPSYPHPTKVRHNTSDGSLRIESRFSTSPGNDQIIVKMNVRNNSAELIEQVFLTRFIDADISNTGADDQWTSTVRSVTAHEPGSASLQMFPKNDEFPVNSMIFTSASPGLNEFCFDLDADVLLEAPASDNAMGLLYQLGDLAPGETKTVQFLYRITN